MAKVHELDFEHHRPRSIDKKKHHRKGYREDYQDTRQSRVNFKRYLIEMEEELLDQEIDENLSDI